MYYSLRSLMVLAAFMIGGIGSTACASQTQEFPPLINKAGAPVVQTEALKQNQPPANSAERARQRRVAARWQQVQASVQKGEVRTYAATRKQMRVRSAPQDMPVQTEAMVMQAQQSDAPVLCPWGAMSVEDTRMVSMRDSYSIKAKLDDGSNLTILGTCMAADSPATRRYISRMSRKKPLMAKGTRMMKKLDAPYAHSRTEYGQEVEFSKYGCAYTVTYYCTYEEGKNCLTPEQLVSLADDAILMNGPQ